VEKGEIMNEPQGKISAETKALLKTKKINVFYEGANSGKEMRDVLTDKIIRDSQTMDNVATADYFGGDPYTVGVENGFDTEIGEVIPQGIVKLPGSEDFILKIKNPQKNKIYGVRVNLQGDVNKDIVTQLGVFELQRDVQFFEWPNYDMSNPTIDEHYTFLRDFLAKHKLSEIWKFEDKLIINNSMKGVKQSDGSIKFVVQRDENGYRLQVQLG